MAAFISKFSTERLVMSLLADVSEIPSSKLVEILTNEVTKYLPDGWQDVDNSSEAINRIYQKLEQGLVFTISENQMSS